MAESSTIWKIVGITCGVLVLGVLLVFGACVACGASCYQQTAGAATEAHAFLADLKAGRDDAAYERTSPAFRSISTREQFGQFLEANPGFRTFTDSATEGYSIQNQNAEIRMRLATPTGDLVVGFRLSPSGTGWQIDGIDIDPQDDVLPATPPIPTPPTPPAPPAPPTPPAPP